MAPNRIAEGKGVRREAGSEGSRRRNAAPTNRNRIQGQRPWGEPAHCGDARKLPGRGGGKSGGDCGKETGLTLGGLWVCPEAVDYSVSNGVGWVWMSQQTPVVPGRDVPGRAKPLGAGSRPDDSMCVGPQEKTRRASSSWRGAPLGRRRGRKPICAHRGAASVGVGGESSLGAEVLGATKLRGTAGYETRTSGGVGGRGARVPLLPDFRREFQHHRGDRGRNLV